MILPISPKILSLITKSIHEYEKDKGNWNSKERFSEMIADCQMELKRALESYYKSEPPIALNFINDDGIPEGYYFKALNCLIKLLVYFGSKNIDIGWMIETKLKKSPGG